MDTFSRQFSAFNKNIPADEKQSPGVQTKSLLLSILKEEGPVLKHFDSNQLLAAAILTAAILLVILLRSL